MISLSLFPVLCAVVAGNIFNFASLLLLTLRIDDPVDASPAHLFCGFWGLIASGNTPFQRYSTCPQFNLNTSLLTTYYVGLLATQDNVIEVYGQDQGHHYGLFLGVIIWWLLFMFTLFNEIISGVVFRNIKIIFHTFIYY